MKYSLSATAALICLLAGWNPEVRAQSDLPDNPILPQLAEMSGALEAGIKYCDVDGSRAPTRRQQQEQFLQMGGSPEQFETGYQAGYDRAKGQYQAANASERKDMCAQLRQLMGAQ